MIIAFAGLPSSGKTTISKALAELLGIRRVGFGSYVKALATDLNLGTDRKTLQSVGQDAIEKGVESFCENFLSANNLRFTDRFILDGVRHDGVLTYFKSRGSVALVYVTVTDDILKLRLAARNELDLFWVLKTEPTEREVESSLKHQADIVIYGDLPQSEQLAEILRKLDCHSSSQPQSKT